MEVIINLFRKKKIKLLKKIKLRKINNNNNNNNCKRKCQKNQLFRKF